MDPSKSDAVKELQRRYPNLSAAEAYAILERAKFDASAAAKEAESRFVASAGDHGVMYETPAAPGSPDGVKTIMEDLFRKGDGASGSPAEDGQAFFGSGKRLGHTEMPSPAIASAVRQQRTVTVAVYANVIRVDGGRDTPVRSIPLRSPEARSFMSAMQEGVVPPELERLFPNCDVHVELQDCMNRDYEESAQEFKAFQDEGNRLGTSSPSSAAASSATLSYDPNRRLSFDEGKDATVVRVVNTKGGQTEVKVNPSVHTVEDLYAAAHEIEPDRKQFVLEVREMPPRKLGAEIRSQTIEAAKLKRAVVVMRPV